MANSKSALYKSITYAIWCRTRVINFHNACLTKVRDVLLSKVGPPEVIKGSLLVCLIFASIQYPLYIADLLAYNPFQTISDLVSNFIFAIIVISITGLPIAALVSMLGLYVIGGVKYYYLRNNLAIGDLFYFKELIEIYPLLSVILLIFLIIGFAVLVICLRRVEFPLRRRIGWLLFSGGILGYLYLFPNAALDLFNVRAINNFNRGSDFLLTGQLYSIAFDYVEKSARRNQLLSSMGDSSIQPRHSFDGHQSSRNIHIILLESYTSLNRLGVKGPSIQSPYIPLNKITYAISPVFGGNSAASEYEILCGTIENFSFGTLTFNVFGKRLSQLCLPSLLKQQGYRSIASTGTSGQFFNANIAYKSMGFDSTYFFDSYPKKDMDGIRISDKELFEENRKHFSAMKYDSNGPIFNYLVTIAGHSHYHLNRQTRPLQIYYPNPDVRQYLNRIWYTTKELSDHLGEMKKIDPNSIILILGDHLVPAVKTYLDEQFDTNSNSSMTLKMVDYVLLVDFVQRDAGILAYHEVSKLLSTLLSDKLTPQDFQDDFIGTNGGYFWRQNLNPIDYRSSCNTQICDEIRLDIKYHNELSRSIIKNSIFAEEVHPLNFHLGISDSTH